MVWGVGFLLSRYTSLPELNDFILVLTGAGIFLLQDRQILKMGGSPAMETGILAVIAMLLMLHLSWIFLVPKLNDEEMMSQACSPKSLEVQCYTFSQENCSSVWEHYSQDCNEEIKQKVTSRRSTALTGPMVRRCIYKKLDQSFHSNRRTPLNETCQKLFQSLDAPFQN